MKEEDLKRSVLDMCRVLRLLVAHFRPARLADGRWRTPVEGDGKGFPDCVITGPGGVLFVELKSDHESPSSEQRRWISALGSAGADVRIWRPRDLRDGGIELALKRLAKPRAALDQAEKETR
jgi:hypothetical protein